MRWTGTHQGELFGIPPTGKRMSIGAISITRVENGMGVEHWSQVDQLGMIQQLGLIPSLENK
jgi:predicted ester cyclase